MIGEKKVRFMFVSATAFAKKPGSVQATLRFFTGGRQFLGYSVGQLERPFGFLPQRKLSIIACLEARY